MKLNLSKKQTLLVMFCLVLMAGVITYMVWSRQTKAEQFMTAKVEKGNIRNTVSATGTLQAVTTVQVGSQVSGTIQSLHADFNSSVKKGQVIAQLDPAVFRAQVKQASASLSQARSDYIDARAKLTAAKATVESLHAGVSSAAANVAALKAQRDDALSLYKRQEALAESGIATQRDLESARTSYQSAEARYNQAAAQLDQARLSEQSSAGAGLEQAEALVEQTKARIQQAEATFELAQVNLSHTTIRSPVDGVVVSRNVDVGQTVAASLQAPTLFTIANDLTQMQVIANIDQADIGMINSKVRVSFTVDAFPRQEFTGAINQIRLNPQTVQNVITYNVVIDVKNPDLKLLPGMTTNLTLTVAERLSVLKVPNAALRFIPQGMTQEQVNEMLGGTSRRAGGQDEKPGGTPYVVWVLDSKNKSQPRKIRAGITDGVNTEIIEGELKEGETVITGQTTTDSSQTQSGSGSQAAPGFGGGGPGGPRMR
jgi:HlyD family secretion protein